MSYAYMVIHILGLLASVPLSGDSWECAESVPGLQ